MQLIDPQTQKKWSLEYRVVNAIKASVTKRQLANFKLKPQELTKIFKIPKHLRLWQDENGKALLSLCMIWMDSVAPDWMPLDILPKSFNCALRISCVDQDTGENCVWVDTRYSDNFLVGASKFFGLHGFSTNLNKQGEKISTPEWEFEKTTQKFPGEIMKDKAFDQHIADGVISYSYGKDCSVSKRVDLIKEKPSVFHVHNGVTAKLRIGEHVFTGDLRESAGSLYTWEFH
ncbi:hypothetical protein PQO01_02100 [Lentisphaera marina]|uniref:hypothetical protein n=1 Tax=Lentisphaera marina TaxID=1111041 RepID=UPI00236511BB|nr:hypothetical protein [Lentisphaera marina]MDD7983737.1 hypothetical protein [Lentisphaera marina]